MGIDVSHHQGNVDWNKVKAAGNGFAFAKATESVSYIDPMFKTNWDGMQQAGIIRGAYHFYQATQDPVEQANHFLSVLNDNGFGDDDLPPVLDLEDRPGAAQIGSARLITDVTTWLETVSEATGRIPIIYADPDFWHSYMNNQFGQYFLWIANYGVPSPHIPGGWTSWTFWQYSDNGTVDGVSAHVDQDHFIGGPEGLADFVASSKA